MVVIVSVPEATLLVPPVAPSVDPLALPPPPPPPTTVIFIVVLPLGIVNVPDDVETDIVEKPPLGVAQVGKPDPALVKTCPLEPAAPASVNAVVRLADASVAVVIVGLVANTFEPVPVFATLTNALDASVATALEAVKLE